MYKYKKAFEKRFQEEDSYSSSVREVADSLEEHRERSPSETSSSYCPGEEERDRRDSNDSLCPPTQSRLGQDSNDSQEIIAKRKTRDSNDSPPAKKRLGKDEKLAREKGITLFISVDDIINLPMDEFNDALELAKTKGMTEEQYTIARDIRRRGKNKNAAQNCRKRANTRLEELKSEVEKLKKEEEESKKYLKDLEEENLSELEMNNKLGLLILRYRGYDSDHFWVEDIRHAKDDHPFPFDIHLKSPSPERPRYHYPVQPKAVRVDSLSYQPPPYLNTIQYPAYVTKDTRGAVLYQVNPGIRYFQHPHPLQYPPASLYPVNHHEVKIKEEIENLSKG